MKKLSSLAILKVLSPLILILLTSCKSGFWKKIGLLNPCPITYKNTDVGFVKREQFQVMDIHKLIIDGEIYFLMTQFLHHKKRGDTVEAVLYQWAHDQLKYVLTIKDLEHARHVTSINTKWGSGFVIADHGIDVPGQNVGGLSRLFVKSKNGHWGDKTSALPIPRNYSFNATAIKMRTGPDWILLSSVLTLHGRPILLEPTDNGYKDVSEKLPFAWRSRDYCFMTSKAIDLDLDGVDEVIVGSCDKAVHSSNDPHDRIMKFDGQHWDFLAEQMIPARVKDVTWGTVAIEFADLNNDGRQDYLATVHNVGFSEGALQFHYRDSTMGFKTIGFEKGVNPFEDDYPGFIAWTFAGELNGDSKTDIVGVRRIMMPSGKPYPMDAQMMFVWLGTEKNGDWQDISQCMLSTENDPVIGAHFVDNNALLVFQHSGRIQKFQFKSKASPPNL